MELMYLLAEHQQQCQRNLSLSIKSANQNAYHASKLQAYKHHNLTWRASYTAITKNGGIFISIPIFYSIIY